MAVPDDPGAPYPGGADRRRRRVRLGPDLRSGEPPDYRFSLANERTLLAYVRTALALNAGGLAAATLLPADEVAARGLLGGVLVTLGALLTVGAFLRWSANEDAMRHDTPLPRSTLPLQLAVVSILVSVTLVVLLLVR